MTPSEAWDRYCGDQTVDEFLSGMGLVENGKLDDALTEYLADWADAREDFIPEYEGQTAPDRNEIATLLEAYIRQCRPILA